MALATKLEQRQLKYRSLKTAEFSISTELPPGVYIMRFFMVF